MTDKHLGAEAALERVRAAVEAKRRLPPPKARVAIRVGAGLSREQMASTIPVSRQTIRAWELGLHEPSGTHLEAYVRVLAELRDALGRAS